MVSQKTAVVIGAGIGGIATAARMARNGFQVTVVEKNEKPGGRCYQIVRDGHRFDVGPTLFLMPEVFAETYSALGERMEDHLDLRRIDPTYTVRFSDGFSLQLTADLLKMQPQLEAIEKNAFDGFLRYIAEGNKHYRVSLEKFVGRNFESIFQYFSPANLPLLFQLKALTKHYKNIGSYFDEPRLKAAFTFQNMYLGLSPYDAPATYSLLQYTELAGGVWFPMGGMYRVIESLIDIAEQMGVRFVYKAPVKQLLVEGNQVTSALLEDGSSLTADLFVGNADLPYIYKDLLPDAAEAKKLEQMKYTSSAIMFYWGVDKLYPEIDPHNIFLAGDYKKSFDSIFEEHTLPGEPSFYVHAPARIDPESAPAGQDTLMALVPVGHLDDTRSQNWETLVDRARETVFERIARQVGVNDLRQHIKFEIVYTPRDWQNQFNLVKGSAFGLSHNFLQVGYLRPQNRHPRYKNLYFAGASTHPGTGLPLVLLSAKLTTERILRELGQYNEQQTKQPARIAVEA
jgi:phytoene desaturase